MKKHIWLLCFFLIIVGCSNKSKDDENNVRGCDGDDICDISDQADMSGYETMKDADHRFVSIQMNDFLIKMENKESGIFYFGYESCPWCKEAVPIMNEVAKEQSLNIYYIDKKAETSDEATVGKVEEVLSDILTEMDGKPHLYVPEVVVVKDGNVMDHHLGTIGDYDAHERTMTSQEAAQLKQRYQEMFSKIKE